MLGAMERTWGKRRVKKRRVEQIADPADRKASPTLGLNLVYCLRSQRQFYCCCRHRCLGGGRRWWYCCSFYRYRRGNQDLKRIQRQISKGMCDGRIIYRFYGGEMLPFLSPFPSSLLSPFFFLACYYKLEDTAVTIVLGGGDDDDDGNV